MFAHKKSISILIFIGVVFSACYLFWDSKDNSVNLGQSNSSPIPSPVKSSPGNTTSKNQAIKKSELWEAGLIKPGEFRLSDFSGYLANNHTAQASAAVFDFTQDCSFLIDSLREWPDSIALLKRVAICGNDNIVVEAALTKLRSIDEHNSFGSYMSAALAIKTGKPENALSLLKEGLDRGAPNSEASDDIIARRTALLSIGIDKTAADLKSLFPKNRIESFLNIKTISNYYAHPENSSVLESDPAILDSVIGMLAHLRQTRDGGAFPQLDVANEVVFLQRLNPEDIVGQEKASSRIASLNAGSKEALQIFQKYSDAFPRLSKSELSQYADKVMADGEWAAIKQIASRVTPN